MDFEFDEAGKILKKSARDFLIAECPKSYVKKMAENKKGYSHQMWSKIAELGWLGHAFPEKYDGGGGSFVDLMILLEEMGRACLPGPFFSTVVLGGMTISDAGNEDQKSKLLSLIAKGKCIVTMALNEPDSTYSLENIKTKAVYNGNNFVISGTKLFVPDAHIADFIICASRSKMDFKNSINNDGISLFLVGAKTHGIKTTLLKTISSDKQCEVIFDNVNVPKENILGKLHHGSPCIRRMVLRAAICKCAEMIGGAEKVLEMTVDYVKQRTQFGHPIGSFQSIQAYCVQMLSDVETSRFITHQAAWKISNGLPYSSDVSMAKAWVSDTYKRIVSLGHQCFGGIAYIADHDMHLYLTRAKAAEIAFGDADFHRELLAHDMKL